jgi:steroid delta-isomerase-like uncharacterized protein
VSDQGKERLRQFYDVVVNQGDVEKVDEFCTEDFVDHEEFPGITPDRAGVKDFFVMMRKAFPDLHVEVHDIVADGDLAVARATMTGTHQGEFMGVPPTGRRIEVEGFDMVRIPDGQRATAHWGVMDAMTMMQQLGAIPEPEQATA